MKTHHEYDAYGLRLRSELPLPELAPAADAGPPDRAPDVTVRLGAVPERIDAVKTGVVYQAGPDRFLLRIDGVAAYLVEGGTTITVEPAPEVDDGSVRVFLLGSGLAALLHQRGLLTLHASAITTDAGAVLFMASSGNGKSALLYEFIRRGYRMIGDDVIAITMDGAGEPPRVLPAYPQTKLWADVAEHFELDTSTLRRVRPGVEKFAIPTLDRFHPETTPLHRMYVLRPRNRPGIELEAIQGVAAFRAVLTSTYRRLFLPGLGMQPRHFELATRAASAVPLAVTFRPRGGTDTGPLADALEADFGAPVALDA